MIQVVHRGLCSLFIVYMYLAQCCLCISLLEPRDLVYSGNYVITNCNASDQSTGVIQLLPRVSQALQLVLGDLKHGTTSRHGFPTFLKSNIHLPIIRNTLRAISDGEELKTGKTTIECSNPYDRTPGKLDMYNMACFERPQFPVVASAFPDHGLVVLCPDFWTLKAFPNIDDCPAVSGRRRHRKFVEYGSGLIYSQFASLLHELIHLYNPVDGGLELGEVYTAQDCTNLDSRKSIRNAGNWALYAAGEL